MSPDADAAYRGRSGSFSARMSPQTHQVRRPLLETISSPSTTVAPTMSTHPAASEPSGDFFDWVLSKIPRQQQHPYLHQESNNRGEFQAATYLDDETGDAMGSVEKNFTDISDSVVSAVINDYNRTSAADEPSFASRVWNSTDFYAASHDLSIATGFSWNWTSNLNISEVAMDAMDGIGYNVSNSTTGSDSAGASSSPDNPSNLVFIIAMACLLGGLILVTVIGNVFVIAAIVLERHLQTPQNYLIVSLAVADLLVACLVMPLGAVYEISREWILGPELCDMWTLSDVLCCAASILHLLAIAADRYFAVTNVNYMHTRSERQISAMIAMVWGLAVIVSVAPILGWKDPEFKDRVIVQKKCLVSQDLGYQIFATMATFYIPLLVILLLYWQIYQAARNRIRRRITTVSTSRLVTGPPSAASSAAVATANKDHGNGQDEDAVSKGRTENTLGTPKLRMETEFNNSDMQRNCSPKQTAKNGTPPSSNAALNVPVTGDGFRGQQYGSINTDETASGVLNSSENHIRSFEMEISPSRVPPIRISRRRDSGKLIRQKRSNCQESSKKSKQSVTCIGTRQKKRKPAEESSVVEPAAVMNQFMSTQINKRESLEAKRERKAAKTLAIVTGAFVVCWLPFFVVALALPTCGGEGGWCEMFVSSDVVFAVCLWLGYFNSTLNPIIYTIFSPDFRCAFKKILCGPDRRVPGPNMRRRS